MPKRLRRNNRIRAGWAETAVIAFARETHMDSSGDLEHACSSVIGDLVANLMHYCDVMGHDFEACLSTARMHYEHEVENIDDHAKLDGEPLYAPGAA